MSFVNEVTHSKYLANSALCSVVTSIPFYGGILSPDDICGVRYSSFRPLKKGTLIAVHGGSVWDIATSQGGAGAGVHPMVLTAGSDGVCSLINPTSRLLGLSKADPEVAISKFRGHFAVSYSRLKKMATQSKCWKNFPKRRYQHSILAWMAHLQHQELQNFITTKLFDELVTITKVTWCPNSIFPGLYAAGLRCGLLRIANLTSNS